MTYSTSPPPPPPPSADRLASIRTYVMVAWIFSIIIMVVWALIGIGYIALFAIAAIAAGPFGIGIAVVGLATGAIFLIFLIPAFLVFMRVSRMHRAVNAGDIATLKANSSIGWGIVALIFVGVITGIMLLIADGPIKQL